MDDPQNPPAVETPPSEELRRILIGVNSLIASANILLGVVLLAFSEEPWGVVGMAILVWGLLQKMVCVADRFLPRRKL